MHPAKIELNRDLQLRALGQLALRWNADQYLQLTFHRVGKSPSARANSPLNE
jgi:hypothetical protein